MLRFSPKLILLLVALAVFSAHAPANAQTQGKNVVEGSLVNRTDPTIVAAGTDLEVINLSSGMDIIKTAATDSQGKFRVEGLPERTPLMLRAVYKGVNYHGMLSFDAAGLAQAQIEVYEPTTSMKDIQAKSATLAFQMESDHLHAVETWEIDNNTNPPRVYIHPEGNFRISKAPGILEPPKINASAAGAGMPLTQSALESADGKSYYSLYPLRPGRTVFEVRQTLPYTDRKYVYAKKFFMDAAELSIGVIPADMTLSGDGLVKTETYADENFAVYSGAAVKAGDEVAWTLSGGTPVVASSDDEDGDHGGSGTTITAMDGVIGKNALMIGSALLLVFVAALWIACARLPDRKS
ncbi:MAG: hypothetical protein LBP68_07280 [Acidobacteriota bacterium]|jgi:hypothetical protein|nr:hypothetical protein [Acidobacteriota bacterium]